MDHLQISIEQLISDLRSAGMSPGEMAVLAVILNHPLEKEHLRSAVEFEFRGDPLEQSGEHYAHAIETCFERGWLENVTDRTRRYHLATLKREAIPRVDDGTIPPHGAIDLTMVGYEIFRAATWRRYGTRGTRSNPAKLQREIYSDSKCDCVEYTTVIMQASPQWEFEVRSPRKQNVRCTLASCSGPVPCSAWRLNRFEVVPRGYLVLCQYVR